MKKRLILLLNCATLSIAAHAGYSQDSGRISQLWTNTDGAIAIMLDNGFPNAMAAKQCTTSDGNYAGIVTADPIFKAALLMAKSKGSTVTVTTQGCEGGWFKILDVYVK